jgi:hypothetical protein
VPKEILTVGLNTLTLVYSDTPRTIDPGFRGRNTAVAVDWLRFQSEPSRSPEPATVESREH